MYVYLVLGRFSCALLANIQQALQSIVTLKKWPSLDLQESPLS